MEHNRLKPTREWLYILPYEHAVYIAMIKVCFLCIASQLVYATQLGTSCIQFVSDSWQIYCSGSRDYIHKCNNQNLCLCTLVALSHRLTQFISTFLEQLASYIVSQQQLLHITVENLHSCIKERLFIYNLLEYYLFIKELNIIKVEY